MYINCQYCQDMKFEVMYNVVFRVSSFSGGYTYLTNLMMDRFCRVNLNYSDFICDDLDNNTLVKEEIQVRTAYLGTYETLLDTLPSVIICLLIGKMNQCIVLRAV